MRWLRRSLYSACALALLHVSNAAALDSGDASPCNDFCKTWMGLGRKIAPEEEPRRPQEEPAAVPRRAAAPLELNPPAQPPAAANDGVAAERPVDAAGERRPKPEKRVRASRTKRGAPNPEEAAPLHDAGPAPEPKRAAAKAVPKRTPREKVQPAQAAVPETVARPDERTQPAAAPPRRDPPVRPASILPPPSPPAPTVAAPQRVAEPKPALAEDGLASIPVLALAGYVPMEVESEPFASTAQQPAPVAASSLHYLTVGVARFPFTLYR